MGQGSHARAAVVGARGFLGSALVRLLRARGTAVTPVTRDDPALRGEVLHPGIARADTVVWAASTVNPRLAEEHPERADADRRHLAAVLRRLGAVNPSARVVLLSSGGTVYGDAGQPPFAEHSAVEPSSAYGRAKLAMEQVLAAETDHGVVVRVSNAYGPGQHPAPGQGVIGHWLRAAARGESIMVLGSPGTLRDYVYVDDVADALVRLHELESRPPRHLNIGSGRPTSLQDVLDVVREVVGPRKITVEEHPARNFDLQAVWLDTSLAHETIGWRATTELSTGVAAMWEWVRTR